jgi:hypothetical protein
MRRGERQQMGPLPKRRKVFSWRLKYARHRVGALTRLGQGRAYNLVCQLLTLLLAATAEGEVIRPPRAR